MTRGQSIGQSDPATLEAAKRIAKRLADEAFKGRTGHGGAPATERHLKRCQFEEWTAGAFELGAAWERGRAK